MNSLYETIEKYCALKGKTVGGMCSDIGISKGIFSSLKSGKSQSLSMKTLSKISEYLNVPIEAILGSEEKEQADITFDDFTYAMHNEGKDLTDEQKQMLLDLAREFNKKLREEKEKR